MNNRINFRRFMLFVHQQWAIHRGIYLLSIPIVAGVISMYYLTKLYVRQQMYVIEWSSSFVDFSSLHGRKEYMLIVGALYVALLAGNYFGDLNDRTRNIQAFTLPVSALERAICALLFPVFGGIITYVTLFLVIDTAFVSALQHIYADSIAAMRRVVAVRDLSGNLLFPTTFGFPYFSDSWAPDDYIPLLLWSAIGMLFLVGTLFFKKLPFVKTAVVIVGFVFVTTFLGDMVGDSLKYGKIRAVDYGWETALLEQIAVTAGCTVLVLLLAGLTLYHRFKDREI
ncbi:hypothetical protein [Parapedobacter sp. DT-150]|uniref:hypothetical protein n=1 Tax=Parapedobacter sp. DT-150 TaxID=3396162 RepID=UPI003F196C0E